MQFITIALLAAASLANAQSVPASAPGCVKYCLRIAREQTPSACNWAGWCTAPGFQDSVSNCYSNICGPANQQLGAQIYQQICASAGSDTTCPSGGASATPSASAPVSSAVSSISESATSAVSSLASEASSAASSASDVVTTIGGVATTVPASATSSLAGGLSSSAAQASSSAESVSSSVESALSTATAPVSSAISSLLSSAASVVSSATAGGANATQSSNAASMLGLPSFGQIASFAAVMFGVAAGALML